MGRDDRESGSKRRNFGPIDPFCLFAVIPLTAVGLALVFSDVAILAPVLLLIAALIVVFDSWLHRPGRLIDPKAAKAALRQDKEGRRGGSSEVRRTSRSQAGSQSAARSQGGARSQSGARSQNGRTRQQGGQYSQAGSRQQPRARQQPSGQDYRERERGRSRY
jgi:hypothetical protein